MSSQPSRVSGRRLNLYTRCSRPFTSTTGLQCGFCTPGFVMAIVGLLSENATPTEEEMEAAVAGNLCRCTGYAGIRKAVRSLAVRQGERG